MKKISLHDLDDLAVGSAILGSGGGGNSSYFFLKAKYQMEKQGNGFVPLIAVSELKPEDLVIPVGYMGAPLAEMEKIPSGNEFPQLFELLEKTVGKKASAIMPFEIGGGIAFTPIMAAAQLNLPVVDADLMGRAFPEAQMISCQLYGGCIPSAFVVDTLGNTVIINARNNYALEKFESNVTITMGSWSAFTLHPITGADAEKCTIHKSISKAIALGKAHREAKNEGVDPMKALLHFCKGVCIGSGVIADIDRVISKGFLNGKVVIQNRAEKIEVFFQNEYLIAKTNGKFVATTPDILMLLEHETGTPIASDSLQYGLKVNLIALPAPNIWTTPEGLELVGPRYFGYDADYKPINKIRIM